MGKPRVNIASGDDRVAVQVGKVTGRGKSRDKDSSDTAAPARTVNIVTGNARVGVQADRVDASITVTF